MTSPCDAGATVTVLGRGADGEPTTREWADWAETIEHEVVTGLGARSRTERVTLPVPNLRSVR